MSTSIHQRKAVSANRQTSLWTHVFIFFCSRFVRNTPYIRLKFIKFYSVIDLDGFVTSLLTLLLNLVKFDSFFCYESAIYIYTPLIYMKYCYLFFGNFGELFISHGFLLTHIFHMKSLFLIIHRFFKHQNTFFIWKFPFLLHGFLSIHLFF